MTVLADDWWPAEVPDTVAVAEGSWLYSSFAFIHHRSRREPSVRIGRNSWVYGGAQFELGPHGSVEIGEHCSVGGTVICTNGRVTVGDYGLVGSESVIADTFVPVPFDEHDDPPEARATVIGDLCWIGRRAILLGGVKLGDGVIVGPGAVEATERRQRGGSIRPRRRPMLKMALMAFHSMKRLNSLPMSPPPFAPG